MSLAPIIENNLLKNNALTVDRRTNKTIAIDQVIMLKGSANYTFFYLKNGKKYLAAHTLKYYENALESRGFLRVHRGAIVNPDCVLHYNIQGAFMELAEGHKTEVSLRRKKVAKHL
jgi:two-component system, LytTR family, response regulator